MGTEAIDLSLCIRGTLGQRGHFLDPHGEEVWAQYRCPWRDNPEYLWLQCPGTLVGRHRTRHLFL